MLFFNLLAGEQFKDEVIWKVRTIYYGHST